MIRRTAVLLACVLSATPSPSAAQACAAEHAGVTFKVIEDGHDGRHELCAERLAPVDANSDLLIEFTTPPEAKNLAASPEWKRLADLVDRVRGLEADVFQLNAAPTPADSAGLHALRAAASAVDTRVADLLASIDSLPLSAAERRAVLTGRFPGGTGDPTRAYANLNLWLDQQLRLTTARAEAFATSKQRVVVQVEAFRDPRGGKRSALHVENYDDLPVGELRPIERLGLQLTPAERATWEASLAANQRIAAALGEIISNREGVVVELRERLSRLGDQVQQVAATLAAGPDAWSSALADHVGQLDALAANASAETRPTLQALSSELRAFRQEYAGLRGALSGVGAIATTIRSAPDGDLRTLLFKSGGVVDQLGQLDQSFRASLAVAKRWPNRIDSVKTQLASLAGTLPDALAGQLLPADVSSFFSGFPAVLGNAATALAAELLVLPSSRPSVDAQGSLSPESGKVLPRALDDLPRGRLELARAGWVLGDRVLIVVSFREAGGQPGKAEPGASRSEYSVSYRGEAVLTGLHRELSSALIFASPLHGPESTWKPNVAALVGWHYYKRDPRSFGGKFWNWLNPGLGIHLASLDQAEDNFEFGLGGNLTIWDGLLSGGFGWNLSRTNGEYWLLAVDLFETLDQIRH